MGSPDLAAVTAEAAGAFPGGGAPQRPRGSLRALSNIVLSHVEAICVC